MPALILYLIKFSCSLGIVWLFYRGVLHSLTFYNWNRWYLLGYSLLCFVIPFVNIGPIYREDPALQPLVIQYIPVIGKPAPATATPVAGHSISWSPWNVLLVLLALGSCFLLLRFLLRCYSLKRLRQRAVLLREGPVNIFRVREPVSPFSFGNAIYVNTDQHSEKEWEEIIFHEYVHIRQRHTLDILFGELLVIVNWYNPFAWLIRFSIRQNLEFIADRVVVDNGFDKKGYQYHLLKVVGQTQYRLANNFNFSSLKKRIIMMNKMRSARLHLFRFLFILPLLAILLVAFRDRLSIHHTGKDLFLNVVGLAISMPDRTPMARVVVKDLTSGLQTTTDARGYYKLRIPIKGDSVHIRFIYKKQDYDGGITDWHFPSPKQSKGMCDVGFMRRETDSGSGIYILGPLGELPMDPGYEDALHALKAIQNLDTQVLHAILQKVDPEGRGPSTHKPTITTDTVPHGHDTLRPFQPFLMRPTLVKDLPIDKDLALWVVDGVTKSIGWDWKDSVKDENIVSVSLMTDGQATRIFGNAGANGVIAILTRSGQTDGPLGSPVIRKDDVPGKPVSPLYVIDGTLYEGNMTKLNPADIESIIVLKDEEAKAQYGEKGRYGVVQITTKKSTRPHVVLDTKDTNGKPMTMIVDSLYTPMGNIHAGNSKPNH